MPPEPDPEPLPGDRVPDYGEPWRRPRRRKRRDTRPGPGELLGWGLFSTGLAVVLTLVTGSGQQRALSLGGLGLAATAVLTLAARFDAGPRPPPGRRGDDPGEGPPGP